MHGRAPDPRHAPGTLARPSTPVHAVADRRDDHERGAGIARAHPRVPPPHPPARAAHPRGARRRRAPGLGGGEPRGTRLALLPARPHRRRRPALGRPHHRRAARLHLGDPRRGAAGQRARRRRRLPPGLPHRTQPVGRRGPAALRRRLPGPARRGAGAAARHLGGLRPAADRAAVRPARLLPHPARHHPRPAHPGRGGRRRRPARRRPRLDDAAAHRGADGHAEPAHRPAQRLHPVGDRRRRRGVRHGRPRPGDGAVRPGQLRRHHRPVRHARRPRRARRRHVHAAARARAGRRARGPHDPVPVRRPARRPQNKETPVTRRTGPALALLTGTALLLAACAEPEAEPGPDATTEAADELGIGLTYTPDVQFAPFYVAEARGYYEDAGVDVSLRHHGASEALFGALEAGEADLVVAGGDDMLQARSAGVPVVTVATNYEEYPVVLIVPADSDITTAADLAGHSVGIPGPFGETYFGLLALLDSAGLTAEDVTR